MEIDVKRLAKLSMIKIDDSEIEKFKKDMKGIVEMVQGLPQIDGELIAIDPQNPMTLREDKLSETKFSRDEILANAPDVIAGCVVVPKTLETLES